MRIINTMLSDTTFKNCCDICCGKDKEKCSNQIPNINCVEEYKKLTQNKPEITCYHPLRINRNGSKLPF